MAETQIAGRQIKDGAIDNAKIAAGASIASSKLADGANFIKKDGSVAFTGSVSLGNQTITSVGTPSNATDAANKSYVDSAISGLSSVYKYRTVHVASTANVTISSAPSSIDGHTLLSLERILLKNQSTASQNGIYVFNGVGSALTRDTDSNAWDEITGALVYVEQGNTQADTRWFCTADSGGTLGSTSITYVQDNSGALSTTNFVFNEVPSGSLNGVNTSFTLAYTPTSNTLQLYLNGIRLKSGAGNDYTISTNTITMTTAPISTDSLLCDYMK
jgi:hypothetical protein